MCLVKVLGGLLVFGVLAGAAPALLAVLILAFVLYHACKLVFQLIMRATGSQRQLVAYAHAEITQLQALSPFDFEVWVAGRFRAKGYKVQMTGTTGDHGVDIFVKKGREFAIVQCKRYYGSVGEEVVRSLEGARHHEHATAAYLVTTGRVTRAAWLWAQGKPIQIWDAASWRSLP